MRICQNCKTRNVDESVFCRKCGTKIEENPFICPDCLFENTDDSMFCIKCGTKLAVGGNAKSTIASAASNRTAGYNQETAKQANASATFDYNVYMNGSPSAAAKETTVNDVNFNKATAPAAAEKPAAKPLFTDEANMVGNTVGNIVNEGVVAKQGEWIY